MKKYFALIFALLAAPLAHADIVGRWTFVSSNDPEYVQSLVFEFRADGSFSFSMPAEPDCSTMGGVWSNDTGSSFQMRVTSVTCQGQVVPVDVMESTTIPYSRSGSTVTVNAEGLYYVFQVGPVGSTGTGTTPTGPALPPSVVPSVTGSSASQTISVTMGIASGSGAGTPGAVFTAALLPASLGGSVYLLSSGGSWTPFAGCPTAAAYFVGNLPATLQVGVIPSATDLSGLAGTAIILGYGRGSGAAAACEDMLSQESFAVAYTIQ